MPATPYLGEKASTSLANCWGIMMRKAPSATPICQGMHWRQHLEKSLRGSKSCCQVVDGASSLLRANAETAKSLKRWPGILHKSRKSGWLQTILSQRSASTVETWNLLAVRCICKVNRAFAPRPTHRAGSVEELDATGDPIIVGVSPSCLYS